MFEQSQLSAMFAAVAANPCEDTPRLALADLFAEIGDTLREAQCRIGIAPVGLVFFSGDGYGDGSGFKVIEKLLCPKS